MRQSYLDKYEPWGELILSYKGKIARQAQSIIYWRDRAQAAEAVLWILSQNDE